MPVYALVLTSSPTSPCLSPLVVEHAWSLIPEIQRRSESWLSPGEAWAAEFATNEGQSVSELRNEVRRTFKGLTLDVNTVTGDRVARRKKLLVCDMDSTIIQQECIDEMAAMLGLKPQISAITERAMKGEMDFATALAERVRLLEGLTEDDLLDVYEQRVTLMPGARTMVATMKAQGASTALVSGGFSFFTSRVAEQVGFDVDHANRLEIEEGRMTGRVHPPILGREAKLASLQLHREKLGLAPSETMAVGDGANDLDMIRAAGLGVAYRAKPIVAAEADAMILHGDLTALLYLQGYRRDEFVE